MRRFVTLVLAAVFVAGLITVESGISAQSSRAPVRSSGQALSGAPAITTGHKKKRKKPKKHEAASTANFNSCKVVTQSEAASAIGQPVTPGVLGNATVEGGLACVFYGPSALTPHTPNVTQADSVRVVVVEGSDALAWYNNYKTQVSPQPITGYGDQAYYDGYAPLSVLKGDHYLRIAVSSADAPPSLTDEEQLAAAILPKL